MYPSLSHLQSVETKEYISSASQKKTYDPEEAGIAKNITGMNSGVREPAGNRFLDELPVLAEEHPLYKLTGKYLDPFSTLGFEKIFNDKDLLVPFLRHFLQREPVGSRMNRYFTTVPGQSMETPSALFDLYGDTGEAERVFIEMQREYRPDIRVTTTAHMVALLANEQAPPNYDYRLNHSCLIEILNFSLDEEDVYIRKTFFGTSRREFRNKSIISLELPKFKKKEDELETGLDKWLYALKSLHRLKERPEILCEDEFIRLFEKASVANLTPEEMQQFSLRING